MLDYPASFDTPAFPAGGRVARTRILGVGVMAAFLIIACLCGLLVWGAHSVRMSPFLISIDAIGGSWTVINRSAARHPHIPVTQTAQESVVGNFFQNWFFLPDVADKNADVWRDCPPQDCTGAEMMPHNARRCALACGASAELYKKFIDDELDVRIARVAAGEKWNVMVDTMRISNIGNVSENGGVWMVRAAVWSNISGRFNILAFVRVARDVTGFPMTLGYYVSEFNAYRVLQ